MSFKRRYRLMLLAVIAMINTPASAQTMMFEEMDPSVSYSAWRHVETEGRSMKMREYHAPGRQRLEMNAQGQDMVMIQRNDTGESWMLMPQMQAYMQTSAETVMQRSGGDIGVVERTRVGRERVDGYDTIKYKAIFRNPQGQEGSGYFWLTEQHGIPIRTDITQQTVHGEQRVYMELTDLQVASQPASLFEVPDGYRALPGSMPGMGTMGGMSGGGSQDMSNSGQSYLDQIEARKAQRAQEEQAQAAEQQEQKAALSRLTQAYLQGCWFNVGGERAQIRINADGSYDVGTPAGSGFAMQRMGGSIQAFRSRYEGLVSMTDNRFEVRDRNRNLTYERGTCVGGGGVAGSGYGSHDDAQPNQESNVLDKTADKIKKGIGSFLDGF